MPAPESASEQPQRGRSKKNDFPLPAFLQEERRDPHRGGSSGVAENVVSTEIMILTHDEVSEASPRRGGPRNAFAGRRRAFEAFATTVACGLASVALSTPAWAHHSYAMFNRTKDVALTGTVKDWQWTNPHTWMVLVVPSAEGKPVEWNLEGQSTQVLRMIGMNREVVKPGDRVTVHINPLWTGANGGQIAGVVAADGHVYGRTGQSK